MKKYDITFMDALNLCLDGKAVIGEDFAEGIYMKTNKDGFVMLYDFAKDSTPHYKELHTSMITRGLTTQMYRVEDVLTEQNLYREAHVPNDGKNRCIACGKEIPNSHLKICSGCASEYKF